MSSNSRSPKTGEGRSTYLVLLVIASGPGNDDGGGDGGGGGDYCLVWF